MKGDPPPARLAPCGMGSPGTPNGTCRNIRSTCSDASVVPQFLLMVGSRYSSRLPSTTTAISMSAAFRPGLPRGCLRWSLSSSSRGTCARPDHRACTDSLVVFSPLCGLPPLSGHIRLDAKDDAGTVGVRLHLKQARACRPSCTATASSAGVRSPGSSCTSRSAPRGRRPSAWRPSGGCVCRPGTPR